jgi:hypothetical protein
MAQPMKPSLLFLSLVICSSFFSQTKLFFADADGTIDRNSYRLIIQSTGLVITHDKSTFFRSDTAKYFILAVDSNYVHCDFRDKVTKEPSGLLANLVLGRLDADKKIIDFAAEQNHHDRRPCYIKDSKIYSPDNKVVAFIEGQEIYGAALWLLNE